MAESISHTLSNSLSRSLSLVKSIRHFLWADAVDSGDERSPGGRLKFTAPEFQPSFFGGKELRAAESATPRQPRPDAADAAGEGAGAAVTEIDHSVPPTTVQSVSVACSRRARQAQRGCARRPRGSADAVDKLQCQFLIGIEDDADFGVKGRLLGKAGKHMKDVVAEAGEGTKLRLRGRGSGFFEGPRRIESSDPLMLCVSAPSIEAYDEAKRLVCELLEGIYADYREVVPHSTVKLQVHEGPREGRRR
mmetsp:Transcript_38448/g.102315  ORF Transcript_38448/g.102315 Transcript_38448/m.102315 type:complete len:249 (-) Transcript_38448:97-843(-)